MDVPKIYELALKIAVSKGYKFRGYYVSDGMVKTPALRTADFQRIFFAGNKGFADAFNETNDPVKFMTEYIDAAYPNWEEDNNPVDLMACL